MFFCRFEKTVKRSLHQISPTKGIKHSQKDYWEGTSHYYRFSIEIYPQKMKQLFLILAVFTISLSVFCQQRSRIQYGLFGGINISNAVASAPGEGSSITDSKLGANFGIMAEIPVARHFAIQPEISYANLGWKEKATTQNTDSALQNPRFNLNYLNVAALFKFKIPKTIHNGFGLSVFAGPQFGYLLTANLRADNRNGTADTKRAYKSTDFSAVAGVEYFLPAGVGITVRYQAGIANFFGEEALRIFRQQQGVNNIAVKNNAIALTIGYRF